MNQLKKCDALCSSWCWHTFYKSWVSVVTVIFILQIKLLYTQSCTIPCIKVDHPGLRLWPSIYLNAGFMQGNMVHMYFRTVIHDSIIIKQLHNPLLCGEILCAAQNSAFKNHSWNILRGKNLSLRNSTSLYRWLNMKFKNSNVNLIAWS